MANPAFRLVRRSGGVLTALGRSQGVSAGGGRLYVSPDGQYLTQEQVERARGRGKRSERGLGSEETPFGRVWSVNKNFSPARIAALIRRPPGGAKVLLTMRFDAIATVHVAGKGKKRTISSPVFAGAKPGAVVTERVKVAARLDRSELLLRLVDSDALHTADQSVPLADRFASAVLAESFGPVSDVLQMSIWVSRGN